MKKNPELEAAFDIIRRIVEEAGNDAVSALLEAAGHKLPTKQIQRENDVDFATMLRAPKGVAKALVEKALRKAGAAGVSPSAIQDFAETAEEKKVSYSAIRLELKRGSTGRPKRYSSADGRWYSV
jgi:hypothetical protein